MNIIDKIDEIIGQHYRPEEYPCLAAQQKNFSEKRSLNNLEVLDSTPIFRNSLIKYKALILAGAKLTIGISGIVPYNPAVLQFLKDNGIPVITNEDTEKKFALVLDNAAVFSNFESEFGYVELTRSGVDKYTRSGKNVFLADSGKIKRIETCLGTGESYFRGLRHFGFSDYCGKRLVVFGSGKVASGIIYYAHQNRMNTIVITEKSTIMPAISSLAEKVIDLHETDEIVSAIEKAEYIVTATGVKSAVASVVPSKYVLASNAILANIGVEDEYGNSIPKERVLNAKFPINFALEEPTRIRFIEATLALHNFGAEFLVEHPTAKGTILPSEQIENEMLETSASHGLLSQEIAFMLDKMPMK